jgi:hypothetical protein
MVKIFLGCHPSVDLPAKTLDLAKGNRRTFRSQTSDQKKIYIYIFGQMKKQRWEESEKRTKEERRSEKRKRQKTEDAGA